MRRFTKGFAFVPLLIVFFLLVVSAVTSYVVINQGTGGYKTRAAGVSCSTISLSKCSSTSGCTLIGTPLMGMGSCIGTVYTPTQCLVGTGKSCGSISGYNLCAGSAVKCETGNTCLNGVCTKNGTGCSVGTGKVCGSIGYPNTCPGSEFKCAAGNTCLNLKCVKNGTNGGACSNGPSSQGTCDAGLTCTGTMVGWYCKTTSVDTGGGGGGGNDTTGGVPPADPKPPTVTTCTGGLYCDNTPVISPAIGDVVCGLGDANWSGYESKCAPDGTWTFLGTKCNKCVVTPTPTTTPTATPASGGGGGGGGTTPSVTTSVTTSPTAGATGNVTLNFTLRLQGVTSQPKGAQNVPFKVKLKGSSNKDYVTGTLTADSTGKWKGSVAFSGVAVGTDTKYTIYVKVGKHLQKRICGFSPSETSGGLYNCSDSLIPLASGENNLDFSGIMLLSGDLPSSTGVQNGVVDSYDISYILNNLGATDTTKLAIGDLNFDGVIDTQDRSLIIQSLNVKYDDE